MKKILLVETFLILLCAFTLGACTPKTEINTLSSPSVTETATAEQSPEKVIIYAPASTSSIPVLIAAEGLPGFEVQLYTNQSQANAIFLKGDTPFLVSGLTVGVDLYKNDAPVQMVNSFVTGLSYLVTYGQKVNNLADLKGKEIYIPFAGSPIEEVTSYLAAQNGLIWNEEIKPVYSPFESSVELLKQGTAQAVILPEPNVTLVEGQENIFVSLSLYDEWNSATGSQNGYPQVATFVNSNWAAAHAAEIASFNQAMQSAIEEVEQDPAGAVEQVKGFYKLTPDQLLKALGRTRYSLTSAEEMKATIQDYYQTIGKPLDEKFAGFYYLPAQ